MTELDRKLVSQASEAALKLGLGSGLVGVSLCHLDLNFSLFAVLDFLDFGDSPQPAQSPGPASGPALKLD